MLMKRLLLALMAILLLCTAAFAEDTPVRIMVVSDTHYIAPSLYEGSELFLQAIAQGDGKVAMYSRELLDGLLAEARHQRPDLLVISGDLTFHGAKLSHQGLADALRTLTDEGIPVAVIPGNHDINTGAAVRYLNDRVELVENTDSAAFAEIYRGLTAPEMTGPGSCGVVKLTDKLWVVMGDYSVYELGNASYGLATKAHVAWVEGVTRAAKEAGATLISVSHQNMMAHLSFSSFTYTVLYGEVIMPMLIDAGCRVNLSGHMHLQHIKQTDELTDIATGAWSMTPHRYGIVTVTEDGGIRYEASSICPEHLPEGLPAFSRDFFRSVNGEKQRGGLLSLGLDDDKVEQMLNFANDVNEAYFAGTLHEHPEWPEDPAMKLWSREGSALHFGAYFSTIFRGEIRNNLLWSSEE